MKPTIARITTLAAVLLVLPAALHAAYTPTPTPMPSDNILDGFIDLYKNKAAMWQTTIVHYANFVFWTLAIMDFAWTAIMMALRNADIQEFVIQIVKRLMIIGFFFALLTYGGDWAKKIVDSLYAVANGATTATGGPAGISPSGLFDMAGDLFMDVTTHMGFLHVVEGICSVFCGLILIVALAITCAYLVIALIEVWISINAGVILLGFGGSRWTKDYALAYMRYAMAAGFKLFITQLIIGIGGAIISDWMAYAHQHPDDTTIQGLMLLAAVSVVLAIMVGRIPGLAQGLIQGVSIGGGDELVAPARMAAAGAGMLTGAGAALTAAKSVAATTLGGYRAVRAASTASNSVISGRHGQAFGNRVGQSVTGATGSSKAGTLAGRMASGASRTQARIGYAARALARAATQDVLACNDGSSRNFGTIGGRMARQISDASGEPTDRSKKV